jgi:hypothetical protein
MIHHFSIAARDPEHVAAILAEVIGGELGRRAVTRVPLITTWVVRKNMSRLAS